VSISPELVSELLGLPESERVDLAWRLLDTLHEGSATDDLDMMSVNGSIWRSKGRRPTFAPGVFDRRRT
jgi:hypothetical protein